jgi:hypothetical protein
VRKLVFILASLAGASCALPSSVERAGGTPLANAPVLSSRVLPYRANLSSDHLRDGKSEFWKVHLDPGDYFSLNGTGSQAAGNFDIRVFPAGTDDATLPKKYPIVQGQLSAVIGFTAPKSGTYPIEIACTDIHKCASIRFFVSITHGIVLVVPISAELKLSGTFVVTVRTPEGSPLTSRRLIVDLYGLWKDKYTTPTHHILGSSVAMNGNAAIRYSLPGDLVGQTISLQATASGQGYSPASSTLCQATVT